MIQGDTLPKLRITISNDGVPVDLTDTVVTLHIKQIPVLIINVEIIDALAGQGMVNWTGSELSPSDRNPWNYEFQVKFPDGNIFTFDTHTPTCRPFELIVVKEIA